MTANQVAYFANQERERNNRAREVEEKRANLAKEAELNRSHLVQERLSAKDIDAKVIANKAAAAASRAKAFRDGANVQNDFRDSQSRLISAITGGVSKFI